MGKPTEAGSALVIRNGDFSLRLARVGQGPLIQFWVHQDGNGGRGMIVDVAEATEVVEVLNDLLDEIEEVVTG